jgi:CHASE3 domain sensor protein
MASLLANLKTRTKILGGFACVLSLLLVIGGTGLLTLRQISTAHAVVAQRMGIAAVGSDMELAFSMARRFVREFARTGDPAMAAQGDAASARTDAVIQPGRAEIKNPERPSKTRQIADMARHYIQAFDQVKAAIRLTQALPHDVLDPLGAKLLQDFTSQDHGHPSMHSGAHDAGRARQEAGHDVGPPRSPNRRNELSITAERSVRNPARRHAGVV